MRKLLCVLALMAISMPLAVAQDLVEPEWVYRWYYDTLESDQGDAIVVDDLGNIYVTGHTDSSANYDDFITIRLTPEGDTVWTRIFDSPMDGIDDPEFIEADAAGNVYVTGDVGRSSLDWNMDLAVLKYLPDGTLDWVYQYNGPNSNDDRVEGFGVDGLGYIYAVGYTQIATGSPGREDYLLIKFLPTGDTAWVRTMQTGNQTFDRLYDIAFDQNSNIYVTGGYTNVDNYDIATIKYNQAGDTLWMRLYGNVSLTDDVPVGIGVDAVGNVYIGGSTYNTTKDVLAIKYDANGVFQWATSFDGDGADLDNPKDATVDTDGNVYVVCETTDGGQKDFLVVKFDNTGAVDWDFQYDAGGLENELVFNHKDVIKADNEGNVFFGGATYYVQAGTSTDAMTFKLNADGNIVWYNRYGGPGLDFDQIRAVELDNDNNCYVTGYSDGVNDNWDLFLLKFTGGGQPVPGSISGFVFDAGQWDPIPGVHIVAEGTGVETDTDQNGMYALPDIPEGSYTITFTHDDYYDTSVTDIEVISGENTLLDMGMYLLPGSISGFVFVAGQWDPIPGVHVVAEGSGVETDTDQDGMYTLPDLSVGFYTVTFAHDDYNDTSAADIEVTAGENTVLDMGMYPIPTGEAYLVGDVNMYNGAWPPQVIGGDVTYLVGYFRGLSSSQPCRINGFWGSADANGDCNVIGSDVTKLVSYFRGQSALSFCGDHEPLWIVPGDLPELAPDGWPNCDE